MYHNITRGGGIFRHRWCSPSARPGTAAPGGLAAPPRCSPGPRSPPPGQGSTADRLFGRTDPTKPAAGRQIDGGRTVTQEREKTQTNTEKTVVPLAVASVLVSSFPASGRSWSSDARRRNNSAHNDSRTGNLRNHVSGRRAHSQHCALATFVPRRGEENVLINRYVFVHILRRVIGQLRVGQGRSIWPHIVCVKIKKEGRAPPPRQNCEIVNMA